jgi:hypothetical protein
MILAVIIISTVIYLLFMLDWDLDQFWDVLVGIIVGGFIAIIIELCIPPNRTEKIEITQINTISNYDITIYSDNSLNLAYDINNIEHYNIDFNDKCTLIVSDTIKQDKIIKKFKCYNDTSTFNKIFKFKFCTVNDSVDVKYQLILNKKRIHITRNFKN